MDIVSDSFSLHTFVKILFLDNEDKTLSILNAIEILVDLVILGIVWKAEEIVFGQMIRLH